MRISGDDYFAIYLSPDAVEEIERFVAGEPATADELELEPRIGNSRRRVRAP
jgi:hypothetical protein